MSGAHRLASLSVSPLGFGFWRFVGQDVAAAAAKVEAALAAGLSLFDTAAVYGLDWGGQAFGESEALLGRVFAANPALRDSVTLATKCGIIPGTPYDSSARAIAESCEASLKRLRTDRIDLYLLHWPGSHPIADTIAAFEELRTAGKIRHWGISNFDAKGMAHVMAQTGGGHCAANQVLYNLGERGIEWDLLAACAGAKVAVMAYTPLGRGSIASNKTVVDVAGRHGVSPATIVLAWTMRDPNVISIPKAVSLEHVEANRQAADLVLSAEDLALLDKAFPPPKKAAPLAVI